MKKTINEWDFLNAFEDWETYKDNFSGNGLRALYEYLTEYEESTGEEIELDVVAICCEYSEYESAWQAMEQYKPEDMPVEGEAGDDLLEVQAKNEAKALEWLEERTAVITFDGGVIIQQF